MENLKSVLALLIEKAKPYALVGIYCLLAGFALGLLL